MNASPLSVYQEHLEAGRLAYQVDESTGKAIFYPRVAAPVTGEPLTWRFSAGLGTVYSVTVISPRAEAPYNVALIDMDEGFRVMSQVESIPPEQVHIGMRVRMRVRARSGEDAPYPVFDPAELAA